MWAALIAVNAVFLVITFAAFVYADVAVDWNIYTEAGARFFTGELYEWDGLPYRYSPVLAPLFLAPIGYLGWTALHFLALLTIPRRLALIALVSAPFWNDVYNGNTMTFVFVAAVWALRGKPWAFFVLAVLIPRPVMLPVLAWVLWHRRDWINPFLAIGVASLALALASGWLDEWIMAELGNIGRDDLYADLGPAALIGVWWYPIGWTLAVLATWRGYVGVGSFLASGFWSLHYALMLLLDLPPAVRGDGPVERAGRAGVPRPASRG